MKNSIDKGQINNSTDIYEEMEQDNRNDDLIEKKRLLKNKGPKIINNKLFIFIFMNITIFIFIYLLYIFFQKDININRNRHELENNTKNQNKLSEINLKNVNIINNTDLYSLREDKIVKFPIESISQFPSGNIITVDWITINIYDTNYNLIQKISVFDPIKETYQKKDQKKIYKAAIKDENNFAICANDGSLKIYNRQGKDFALKQNIEKEDVIEIIYDSEGKIITGCRITNHCSFVSTL